VTHKECLVSWIVVRNDPKLPDDSGTVPKPNKMVGGSIHDHEIVCLLNRKLAKWSSASCVLKKNIQKYHGLKLRQERLNREVKSIK
jgi:hypothetical protein